LINNILNLEIQKKKYGKVLEIPKFSSYQQFAIDINQSTLKRNITSRIFERIDQGMIDEVDSLSYLGEKRLFDLGLEYRYGSQFLQGSINEKEFEETLIHESINYSKRQLTWLKAQRVTWINSVEEIIDTIS
jgi:tRNA A37 N6-isopentenylltransferase MiaA